MNEPDQLDALLGKLLDDSLTKEEQAALAVLLRADPAARQAYLNLMLTDAALSAELGHQAPHELRSLAISPAILTPVALPRSPILGFLGNLPQSIHPAQFPLRFLTLVTAFTSIFWLAVLTFIWWPAKGPQPETPELARVGAPHVAILSNLQHTQWATGQIAHRLGERLLPQQRLNIAAGIVQLTFVSGARVAIEGPASLVVSSPGTMNLETGRLLAQVPPQAAGFKVHTPHIEVIDLGTEFGIAIEAEESEVQVFNGRVEARSVAKEGHENHSRQLLPGKAIVFGNSPALGFYVKEKKMNRTAFLSLSTVLAMAVASTAQAVPVTIYSDPTDAILSSVVTQGTSPNPVGTKIIYNTTGPLIMGNFGSDPVRNGNAIMFFQLPANVQSIDAATLSVHVDLSQYGGSASSKNVDAWGLGYQSGTTIDMNNWFNTANTDAGAGVGIASRVKIQDNLIAATSLADSTSVIAPPALRSTSGTALRNYLQSLYTAGAQAGDYAIIRLNLDYNPGTAISRFRILSGDDANVSLRPVLQLDITEVPPIPAPEPSTGILIPGAMVLFGLKRRMQRKTPALCA